MSDALHEAEAITPYLLMGLMHHSMRGLSRHNHRKGHLHHAKMRAFTVISAHKRMSQNDLLTEIAVRASSLSEIVSKLEQDGLITKERSEQDKRAYLLRTTNKGEALARELAQEREAYANTVFANFTETERRQLGALLTKLVGQFEKERDRDGEPDPIRAHPRYSALEPYAVGKATTSGPQSAGLTAEMR